MKKSRNRLIMGRHCIEVVKNQPGRLTALYTTHDKKDDPLLKGLKVPVHFVGKHELNRMVHSESHQLFVAEVHEKHSRSLQEFLEAHEEKERTAILALDAINDPQNLGTLFRAAECFGVDAVMFSKNRGADITPVVSKASVGGTELVEALKIANLAESVKRCQEYGYTIVAADISKGAKDLYSYQFPKKFVLILGSEGKGIQKLLMRYVDDCVYIPMLGVIDSLNVSQAAAVFLSRWKFLAWEENSSHAR